VQKDRLEELREELIERVNIFTTKDDVNRIVGGFAENELRSQKPEHYDLIQEIFKPDSMKETLMRLKSYPN
jgi:hypothetical protein